MMKFQCPAPYFANALLGAGLFVVVYTLFLLALRAKVKEIRQTIIAITNCNIKFLTLFDDILENIVRIKLHSNLNFVT